eukprot:853813_1
MQLQYPSQYHNPGRRSCRPRDQSSDRNRCIGHQESYLFVWLSGGSLDCDFIREETNQQKNLFPTSNHELMFDNTTIMHQCDSLSNLEFDATRSSSTQNQCS